MEGGALGVDTSPATDPRVPSDFNIACLRRKAWAKSRDSILQETEPEQCGPEEPETTKRDAEAKRPSAEPGRVPNKITSWLIECRTPLGASLDDQSASPTKGALKNGCSFEDDLSLGAEANHLQNSRNKPESCFGLAADQKRSQYKERGRSMNSTGSGKSSTVSSVSEVLEQSQEHPEENLLNLRVSELLDLYEEDPEEILLNLGFGREEPDLGSKVPARFFNSTSTARGIDIKVYLGAQLQRMELENPNYALTSRFRQIEVLTNVANEFFQLYSQVSGQPIKRISSKDQGGEGGEEVNEDSSPPLKKTNSVRNMAKLLKKSITRANLHASASDSTEANTPNQHTQQNGHTPANHAHTNGHSHTNSEQNGGSPNPDHQAETVNQSHIRKKDSWLLATVTEESNGDGETDDSPEQNSTEAAEKTQMEEEEKNLTSTPEKAPPSLAPPQLAQLRNENADSFEMDEIQSNEDDGVMSRTSRGSDLMRTVSQQSDSSGFAEEPSADSNSNLKVQESSDSCDSETTVTSHPSQDVATPLAMDQPAFILPEGQVEGASPAGVADTDGRRSSREEDEQDGISEQIPQYTAHQIPKKISSGMPQEEGRDEEHVERGNHSDPESREEPKSLSTAELEPQPELEHTQNQPASEPQNSPNQTETATEGVGAESQEDLLDNSESTFPPPPLSPVVSALNRAKQHHLSRAGHQVDSQSGETPQMPGRGRARGRGRSFKLQRSSSLPSSLLSPSRIVSSVRIQFGRGQSSCTQPRYSFKYTHKEGEDKEEEGEEVEEGQNPCRSTLIINPGPSSNSKIQSTRPPSETPIPPKPIPRHLMRSSYSLQSSSPPPDWPPSSRAHSWSTQSVPDLSSSQQPSRQFQQNLGANYNQQNWTPGQMPYPNPNPNHNFNPNPSAQYPNHSPSHSPIPNPSPYPFNPNPPQQYPNPLHPYSSLPNLFHHPSHSMPHHSSQTNLQPPSTPPFPHHPNLPLHPPAPTTPHHASMGNLHPGSPLMPHQGYSHPYSHPSPYFSTPHGSPYTPPYFGYNGYNMNPHWGYPNPVNQFPPMAPEPSFYQGPPHPALGHHPGLGSHLSLGQSLNLSPGAPSNTELQLRRVLQDIRGTVQNICQSRAETPDAFSEHSAPPPRSQSLAEFQQKRRSLNLFRSQMMELELSIIRQQAVVYKHLSPADRLEVEQLQSLRASVREELQELEQQLEDRLLELTQQGGLHRDTSVESLSTASALRAMDPMSDLLREQLYLQSELSDDGQDPTTNASTRSSSPVRGGRGGGGGGDSGTYRASINITPALPPRPNTQTEEEEDKEQERAAGREGGERGGGGGVEEVPQEQGAEGGLEVENLQQLIREIRESVAKEVRREIYSELLATVSPQLSPLPVRQQPL